MTIDKKVIDEGKVFESYHRLVLSQCGYSLLKHHRRVIQKALEISPDEFYKKYNQYMKSMATNRFGYKWGIK